MAGFKITLLVLAALGMAQGHSLEKRATFDAFAFIGSAENAMANAMSSVTKSSAEMKTTVDAATAKLTSYINMARAAQASAQASAEAQIKAITDNATAVAATQQGTQACITIAVGDVKALSAQTLLNLANCLGKKITELENMLQTVVDTGNLALTMTPVAITDINKCHTTGGFFEIFCHGMATLTFVGKVNTVIANVTGVVAGATTLVGTLQADLTTCATVQVAVMAAGAGKLVLNVAVCSAKTLITG